MTRNLYCKCGGAATFASDTGNPLDEEISTFKRDHSDPAFCKLISEKEYRLAQSMDRKPKKKGKRK